MTDLYSLNRTAPAPLPERFITPDGHVRTMPEQWTGEELAEWGFVLAPPRPDDTETQTAEWGGDDWIMVDRPPPPPEPEPEPIRSVTMRQARLALLGAGLLTRADETIAALPGGDGAAARIEWEYAAELRRDHPLVAALGEQFGLDDAAKDNLFRQAATL